MASTQADQDRFVYGIIGSIPTDYHSSDLRNFFSQFLETGGFECFHFRHRPEGKRSQNENMFSNAKSKSTLSLNMLKSDLNLKTNVKETSESRHRNKTLCCVVKLRQSKMRELIKMYHRKHWLDRKGESIALLCLISKIKVTAEKDTQIPRYRTREEQRLIPEDRETFTCADLDKLLELNPPDLMPNGNVGTPTKFFLQLISECRLPPIIIKKLGLSFPKTRSNKRYGNVPFDYGGEKVQHTDKEVTVLSARGCQLEHERLHVNISTSEADQCLLSTETDHSNDHSKRTYSFGPSTSSNKTSKSAKMKLSEHQGDADDDPKESDSGDDNDTCEEWERHEAMYDDPSNQERNKERLFEEEIELKWEKGGSGLVFYTDAQYWDEKEGDFDERTTDDWDVDMSIYYDPDGGDKDARDWLAMRQEQRRRLGQEDTDMHSIGIGEFEKHTKGVGRKVMEKQGWQDGQGLGSWKKGIADALDNEGQKPRDKSGFGYRGEKISRRGFARKRRAEREAIISTVYDNPEDNDPAEPLLRRSEPYTIKYRHEVKFTKSSQNDS